jgi:hypothetical protein
MPLASLTSLQAYHQVALDVDLLGTFLLEENSSCRTELTSAS